MKSISIQDKIRRALASAGLMPSQAKVPLNFLRPPQQGGELPPNLLRSRWRDALKPAHQGVGTAADPARADTEAGLYLRREHPFAAMTRTYTLYVPSSYAGQALPLIVMLHGCKQNSDDFAVGTQMNALAERRGFLVAYPQQLPRDNAANCWNWFEPTHQHRTGAEPALLADMVRHIRAEYRVKDQQVFVAGLSAGAAMAVILGATYPDVFSGVAAHSGLPHGAATDVTSAFMAMNSGASSTRLIPLARPVRTLVLHGDADATVVLHNGLSITAQAKQAHELAGLSLEERIEAIETSGHRPVHRTRYLDSQGQVAVEQWLIQGGSHAWSGGHRSGSYTDPAGPDASAAIVSFFLGD